MEKHCFTCEHEPNWENRSKGDLEGQCKVYPFEHIFWDDESQQFMNGEDDIMKNCFSWKAKAGRKVSNA